MIEANLQNTKKCLLGLTQKELQELALSFDEPAYRGKQLANWLYHQNISSWDEVKNFPKSFKQKLEEGTTISNIEFVESKFSSDDSIKCLFRSKDGYFLETVLIRKNGRHTICVSSQLGCKMNCSFCASSKEGFIRNLKATEIVSQLFLLKQITGERVDNIVYMGMGEPLENFDAVMKSIEIFNSDWGFHIGARKITVSTVGLVPAIKKFSQEKLRQIRLSISVHSPFDDVRREIVPINRKYDLTELMDVLRNEKGRYGREYTFEYTLLKGINDRPEDAVELSKMANDVGAKVNLIAYNPIPDASFERSSLAVMRRFREILDKKKIRNTLRISSGADIDAACGQLRLQRHREQKG